MTIAEQFGARISLSLPGLGLFLMVGRQPGRIAALVGPGGRVAVPLDPCRALVMMPVIAGVFGPEAQGRSHSLDDGCGKKHPGLGCPDGKVGPHGLEL